MQFLLPKQNTKGFSLIEALVVIAIMVIIFAGLFAAFEYSLKLISHSRAKMTALSLATDRMEYLRSLPYNSVGTVSGIPNGAIPQNRTVTLNSIPFNERVLIEFVDDPADGLGALDSNGILADYKTAKIEYTWNIYGTPQSFSLISSIMPRSIETTAGGGTFRVNVFDASALPVAGASVRLFNTTGTSSIDVTRSTDATGVALFTGAPAGGGYEFFVSAPGYSTDQTRRATTSLENPATLPAAVVESDVSTLNFQIDELSDLDINLFDAQVTDTQLEPFTDLLGVVASSGVSVFAGALRLADVAGVYGSSGYVLLNPITPTPLLSWGVIDIESVTPPQTDVRVRFYEGTTTASLISNADLPGNTVGFAQRYIDLRGLNASVFPSIVVGIELTTSDSSVTPTVNSISVSHIESRSMLPATALTLRGNRIIGANAAAQTVYKNIISTTTNSVGEIELENIEFDTYTVTPGGGYVVEEACDSNPFSLLPGVRDRLDLLLTPGTTNNLRVAVKALDNSPVIGATVELEQGGTTWSEVTGWCGQVYFDGLTVGSDYDIDITAAGFPGQTLSSTTISGTTVQEVTMTP